MGTGVETDKYPQKDLIRHHGVEWGWVEGGIKEGIGVVGRG